MTPNKKIILDDPFWLLKQLGVDPMLHNPHVKKLSFFVLILNAFLLFLQCIYIVRSPDKRQLVITYVPTLGFTFFMTFQIFAFAALDKTIKKIYEELYSLMWPLDTYEASSRSKFLREFNFLKVTALVLGVSLTISVLFMSPLFSYEDREIFLIKKMFPKAGKIVDIIFWVNLALLVWIAFSIDCCLFYAICNVKFQLLLLGHYISEMKSVQTSQEFVAKRLRVIIKRHSSLTAYIRKVIRTFWGLLQAEVYMLIIVNTSMSFFFINLFSLNDDWQVNLRSICFSMTSVVLTIHLTALLLQVPDMTEKFFDSLLELPWYSYNFKNQKTLLILLGNSVKPIYINLLGTGRLDSSSVTKYVKMIYSFTMLLYNFKE